MEWIVGGTRTMTAPQWHLTTPQVTKHQCPQHQNPLLQATACREEGWCIRQQSAGDRDRTKGMRPPINTASRWMGSVLTTVGGDKRAGEVHNTYYLGPPSLVFMRGQFNNMLEKK
jgi:hypothetical protein